MIKFTENFCKFKARERKVAHLRVRGQSNRIVNFLLGYAFYLDFFRYVLLIIHFVHLCFLHSLNNIPYFFYFGNYFFIWANFNLLNF